MGVSLYHHIWLMNPYDPYEYMINGVLIMANIYVAGDHICLCPALRKGYVVTPNGKHIVGVAWNHQSDPISKVILLQSIWFHGYM